MTINAWRTWTAYPGHSDVLHSPWRNKTSRNTPFAVWQKATKHAECAINIRNETLFPDRVHPVPGEKCNCGIGVIPEFSDVMRRFEVFSFMNNKKPPERNIFPIRPVIAIGRVQAFGRIHDIGHKQAMNMDVPELRVESACIRELWLPAPPSAALAELAASFRARYRVAVHCGLPDPPNGHTEIDGETRAVVERLRADIRDAPSSNVPVPPEGWGNEQ
ncbi:hypothetical protein [Rhodococcus qingshengii]|uniref:hypothetical protein n=1 Tax=Rhodococcus qingshengii TaxID=334542 RepID=UPI0002B7DCCE|nr:hypothetical protein [Rhodococcus qingshengii]EME17971.1 hypothetical protein G418_20849 [Rhodococcus qingshengii BKS 20-40]